jgi:NTE family protein
MTIADSVMARIQSGMSQLGIGQNGTEEPPPAMLDVLATSINIMQVLITRSRLAGEPADVMITPQLADLGLMEFHRAGTAIDAGRHAAEQVLPQIRSLLSRSADT